MGILFNRVTAGDYKNYDIKVKGFGKKIILSKSGMITNKEIGLNKSTVDRIELVDKSQSVFDFVGMQTAQVAIYFKNGKKV